MLTSVYPKKRLLVRNLWCKGKFDFFDPTRWLGSLRDTFPVCLSQ